MAPEDIDNLTIAEVRAINERAEAALATLRQLGLMGGAATASTSATPSNAVVAPPTRTRTPLSDAELADMRAQKDALMARNLPDEILAAERTPAP